MLSGFIGVYIVDEAYRGKGYGKPLFDHTMNYLKERIIGLDAVEEQIKNYEKSGFLGDR